MLSKTLINSLPLMAYAINGVSALSKGHDLSSAGYMETDQGATWLTESGSTSTIEEILGAGGMDSVRLRLWTGEQYGLDYTLQLAQRFSKAGYKIYLDLHLSDTWADPSNQATPSSFDTSDLAGSVRSYVKSTLQSFADGGVDLDILSIGNEIIQGMLFPDGQISNNDFSGFAALWAAARAGVDDAVSAGATKPQVMIHLNNGWDSETMTWWFKGLFDEGTVTTDMVDVLGFSFYPFFDTAATTDALQSSLNTLASTYNKPLYVAETDWPTSCSGVDLSADFSVDAQGQTDWVGAVIDVLNNVPDGLGAGIFYWEPAFINNTALGSDCDDNILFDVNWDNWPETSATARSSVNMYN
ncbi:putative arabinogalactan endo-beta-1 [Lasiodiplodia hormozganensis]|uniref:Arabinogalactan endo-beta-1,4-galactanase n=3 Tax=Lasiodiplodia TaxID=66739 RepID=A0A5N5DSS6_9PEZI|nr:putative arabinogalactan endo-beta-1,4-galactanase A [Lasiodiplodia theobromae]KAK0659044.1 putative arabinogalactan endo-beta-1 [Lasiodiplodia hormozganensis]